MPGRIHGIAVAILIAGAHVQSAAAISAAQGQEITPDARSHGMGRAFTALADGPNTIWWNPAALALLDRTSISPFSRARLVPDLSDDVWFRTDGASVSLGALGLGWHRSDLDYGESVAFTPQGDTVGTFQSKESLTMFGAGLDLVRVFLPDSEFLEAAIGFAYKEVDTDFAPAWVTPSGQDMKGEAWDADIAMLVGVDIPWGARDSDSYFRSRVAFVRKNAYDHDLEYPDGYSGPLIVRNVIGVGAEAGFREHPMFGHWFTVRSAFERTDDFDFRGSPVESYGAEVALLNAAFLRTGYIHDTSGQVEDTTFGWGLGFDLNLADRDWAVKRVGFRFDRASIPQANGLDENVTHDSATFWLSAF